MKIGVYLPQVGSGATRESMLAFAAAAEECGFDSLWVFDHVVLQKEQGSRYPYAADGRLAIPPTTDFLEPLTALSFVAAATSRVELGVGVLVLPMRQPVLHAKIMASLDKLAGGRFILGAGVGWWQEEFEVLSVPFERRGPRMDECLELLEQCWTRDYVDFEGEFYRVVDWACNPKPARRIPVWLGGRSAQQLRRVGERADGWMANPAMLDTLLDDFARARDHAAHAGRDPDQLTLAINRAAALSASDPGAAAKVLDQVRELGVEHAVVLLAPGEGDARVALEAFARRHLAELQAR